MDADSRRRTALWAPSHRTTRFARSIRTARCTRTLSSLVAPLLRRHAPSATRHDGRSRWTLVGDATRPYRVGLLAAAALVLAVRWTQPAAPAPRPHLARPIASAAPTSRRLPAPDPVAQAAAQQAHAIAVVFRRYNPDSTLTLHIARAVVREGARSGLAPATVAGIVLVENDALKPHVRNPHSGARGLMQVMGLWAGRLGCGSADLRDVDVNICHGTRIVAWLLRETQGDMDRALLRYNGCVRGTVTPDCRRYPEKVYARIAEVRRSLKAHKAPLRLTKPRTAPAAPRTARPARLAEAGVPGAATADAGEAQERGDR